MLESSLARRRAFVLMVDVPPTWQIDYHINKYLSSLVSSGRHCRPLLMALQTPCTAPTTSWSLLRGALVFHALAPIALPTSLAWLLPSPLKAGSAWVADLTGMESNGDDHFRSSRRTCSRSLSAYPIQRLRPVFLEATALVISGKPGETERFRIPFVWGSFLGWMLGRNP
jgi:hypothetical protein